MARELKVIIQPFEGKQNQILQPPFQVGLYQNGFLDAGLVAGEVVVTLLNPNGATLRGTLTRPLQQGIATFSDLSIDSSGIYYFQFACFQAGLRYLDQPRPDVRWRVYGVPISHEYVGYWVHWSGPGAPMGIWAKIVRIHNDAGGSCWEVSQPVGATDLLQLISPPLSEPLVIGYNEADPYLQPPSWLAVPSTPWITGWSVVKGGNLIPIHNWPSEIGVVLYESQPIKILASIEDESCCIVSFKQGGCELELDAGNPEIVLRFNCK